jgi:hypothetical protein
VHYTLGMRRFQGRANLAQYFDRLLGRIFAPIVEQGRKILALDEFHGDEPQSVGNAQVENTDDVAVRDFAGEEQFLFKSLKNAGMAG